MASNLILRVGENETVSFTVLEPALKMYSFLYRHFIKTNYSHSWFCWQLTWNSRLWVWYTLWYFRLLQSCTWGSVLLGCSAVGHPRSMQTSQYILVLQNSFHAKQHLLEGCSEMIWTGLLFQQMKSCKIAQVIIGECHLSTLSHRQMALVTHVCEKLVHHYQVQW